MNLPMLSVPGAIVLPTPAIAAAWTGEHAARLAFIYSRAELRAAWALVPAAARRAGFPRRARAMAADVARRDAQTLSQTCSDFSWVQGAAQRVMETGTPTWWSGQVVDVDTPCPLRPPASPDHRWMASDPHCRYCGSLMGRPDPVHRLALARAVHQDVARNYGLSHAQVAGAISALADAIDAHRGLPPALSATEAQVVDVPAAGARRAQPGRKCSHTNTRRDPVCRQCRAVVGEVSRVSRAALAYEVWEHVARPYGLSQHQVEAAMRDLARLVDAHRGIDGTKSAPGSFAIGHGELARR